MSWKRRVTGDLTAEMLLETLQKLEPEQVLLLRHDWEAVDAYLQETYDVAYEQDDDVLYVRPALVDGDQHQGSGR
jgi:hypothetical protein